MRCGASSNWKSGTVESCIVKANAQRSAKRRCCAM
jgi:hypothetical protein